MPESTFIDANVKASLIKMLERSDRTTAEIRTVCSVIEDALERGLDEIHDYLQEMLPLNVLFIYECFVDYRIFSVVRSLLEGIGLTVARDRRMIPTKVATVLYTDSSEADEALERFECYTRSKSQHNHSSNNSANTAPAPVVVSHAGSGESSLSRNKACVMQAFKTEDKFSGSVSAKISLHRVRNRFIDVIRDQSIPRQEEVNLLHCCLCSMALDFYYKSIRGIANSMDEAFRMLEAQFNTLQHQAQARTYLRTLTFEGIKSEKNCSSLEALEICHSRITDTVPSCGKEYQHDTHYCDFLQNVVTTEAWAQQVIQNRLTPAPNERMDYNTFYSKLGAALTAFESGVPESGRDSRNMPSAAVFFGERYASPVKSMARSRNRHQGGAPQARNNILDVMTSLRPPNRIKGKTSASRLAQLKARTKCLRCHEVGHWRHECPKRSMQSTKQVLMSLVRDIGNDEDAVAAVLWALSEDDDEYYAFTSQSGISLTEPIDQQPEAIPNSFEAFVTGAESAPDYDEKEAVEDLRTCFEVMVDEIGSSENEEQQAFGQPASR